MHPVIASSVEANIQFGIFVLIAAFGFVLGFFTVRGSGINNHPSDGRGSAPLARLPDEFHQFADRQIHRAELRRAPRARHYSQEPLAQPAGSDRMPAVPVPPAPVGVPADDMTLDDVNRRLAAEAEARKRAAREQAAAEQVPRP